MLTAALRGTPEGESREKTLKILATADCKCGCILDRSIDTIDSVHLAIFPGSRGPPSGCRITEYPEVPTSWVMPMQEFPGQEWTG